MKYVRIRNLREDSDLTQKQIAKNLNVVQRTSSGYETGTINIPLECVIKLAEFYNTSVDYLIGRTDDKIPYPCKKK